MTSLTRKALRLYHDLGLLEPAHIDPHSGYRYYDTSQVTQAHIIRRFRELDMPVADIKAVLATSDPAARNKVIGAHLTRMEEQLRQTTAAVSTLRELLGPPSLPPDIELRTEGEVRAWAVTAEVGLGDLKDWFPATLGELREQLASAGAQPTGPTGGLFARELFADGRGLATLYVPARAAASGTGRVRQTVIPAADLAVVTHHGSHDGIDRAYGALGTYVAERLIGGSGPIRERYLDITPDGAFRRTEIAWPVLSTAGQAPQSQLRARRTKMSNVSLPPLVEKYFAAADKNDWDTLAGCFADAGVMIDDGKAYAGRAEIRRRRQEAKSEWAYTSEITGAEPVGATGYHVITHLEGNFPGGTVDLHYQFTLGDGLINSLTIAP